MEKIKIKNTKKYSSKLIEEGINFNIVGKEASYAFIAGNKDSGWKYEIF